MLYWWCTRVVHHCALCAQRYIGGAQWSCIIVHRVHNTIMVVHNDPSPLCNRCTMVFWSCTMVVHHCAPGAQCYIGGALWSCTIVHRVQNAILVVHIGRAPWFTSCTILYWWGTRVVDPCALCAQRYIGGPQWSCTIVHRVQNAIVVLHNGRAPLCTGCKMLYWWGTMVMHH